MPFHESLQAAYAPTQTKESVCPKTRKQWAKLNKTEWILIGGLTLWSLHITDKTSKDKFKKQATYPKGDHIVFKQEYLDHQTRKLEKYWNNEFTENTTNTTQQLLCWATFRVRKYNIPDWKFMLIYLYFVSNSCTRKLEATRTIYNMEKWFRENMLNNILRQKYI